MIYEIRSPNGRIRKIYLPVEFVIVRKFPSSNTLVGLDLRNNVRGSICKKLPYVFWKTLINIVVEKFSSS